MVGVTRRFGPVLANDDVEFRAENGSIHALVGENGAGKSTLMHIAFGLVRADSGTIRIAGNKVGPGFSPQKAMAARVGMVHQHFMLVDDLTVAENIMLGREPTRSGLLDQARAAEEIRQVAADFGVDVDPNAVIEDLSVGQKQRVEILKALWRGCDVLILDEPTAVLTPGEVATFFDALRGLAVKGMSIVIITHKLDEVFEIADAITVMRRGKVVATRAAASSSASEIAELMVGRPVLLKVDKSPASPGDVALEVRSLSVSRARGDTALKSLSLKVAAGEILGVAGVEGNGQTELIASICGLQRIESGSVWVAGREVTTATVAARRQAGIALVPEDRHATGLVLDFSIAENLILGRTSEFTTALGLDESAVGEFVRKQIKDNDIRPTDAGATARGLSGGNQQKVVIARELSREGLVVLIASQPTRGVDIGAIERIHNQLIAARDQGLAILLLSAELSELRSLSDRLVVIYGGEIAAELDAAELADPDAVATIGALMTGASAGEEEE